MVDYIKISQLETTLMVKSYLLICAILTVSLAAIHPTSISVTVPTGVVHLDYSPDHQYLGMISETQLKVVISQNGRIYHTETMQPSLTLQTFAFNIDSQWLALGFKEGETQLYQNDGSKFIVTDKKFTSAGKIVSLSFTSDSKYVVIGYQADKIIAWNVQDNSNIASDFQGELVQSVACSPTDPKVFAVGGGLNTASKFTIFSIGDNQFTVVKDLINDPDGIVNGVAWNGDGSQVCKAQINGQIQCLDNLGVSKLNISTLAGMSLTTIKVSSNLRLMATTNLTHAIFLTFSADLLTAYTAESFKTNQPLVALSSTSQYAFYVDQANAGIILAECDLGTFSDGNGGCDPCQPLCPICDGKNDTCFSCVPGYYLKVDKCVGCPVGCATCTDELNCQSCKNGFEKVGNLCQCSAGTFLNGTDCSSCGIGCDQCTNQTVCITCNAKFYKDQDKCFCKPGTFLDGTTCSACTRGCNECDNSDTCKTCNMIDHYIIDQNDKCVCNNVDNFDDNGTDCICKQKFYLLDTKCIACPLGCKTCLSATSCQDCEGDFVVRQGVCKCPTTDQWFDQNLKCFPCKDDLQYCALCDDPVACKKCQDGLNRDVVAGKCKCIRGFYEQAKVCKACTMLGCEDCQSVDVCLTCNDDQNWQLDPTTKKCKCKQHYFQNNNKCDACVKGCLQCTNSTQCKTCDIVDHWVIDENQKCLCMQEYYQNGQICSLCIAGCLKCQNGTICQACNQPANFVKNQDGICQCKSNKFYLKDRDCIDCYATLKHCDTCTDQANCLTCEEPFSIKAGVCVCDDGKFEETNTCKDCPVTCTLCTGINGCTQCKGTHEYYLKDGHCIGCGNIPRCISCTSQTNCLSCQGQFKLANGKCGCDKGKYVNEQNCADCPEGCTECDSKDKCTACNEDDGYELQDDVCKKSGINTLVIVLIVVGVIVLVGAVFVVIKCIKKRKSPLVEDDYEKL